MSIGLPSWNELTHSLTVTMMSCNIHSAARTLEGFRDESRTEALKALLEEVKQRRNPQKPILMMAWAIKDELGDDLPSQVAVHLYGCLGGGPSSLWTRLLGGIFRGRVSTIGKVGRDLAADFPAPRGHRRSDSLASRRQGCPSHR